MNSVALPETTLPCYISTGRSLITDPILDIEQLLSGYYCEDSYGNCKITSRPMIWRCAAFSELSELHAGFLSFNTGLDYVIYRLNSVCFCKYRIQFLTVMLSLASTYVPLHTMSNGLVVRNFTRTRHGVLSDTNLRSLGTNLFLLLERLLVVTCGWRILWT